MRPDAGQTELLGDRGDDRHRAIGRHREHAVDADATSDLDHLGDRSEVDDLRDVRGGEPRRVGIAIDRRDTEATCASLLDGTPLMAPCAYEENRRHAAMLTGLRNAAGWQEPRRELGPARDVTPVRAGESRPDGPPVEQSGHAGPLRPAVDLRTDDVLG